MKIQIKKEILLENLSNVSKAISTKNIIPVLSGIKFDLKDEGLYLTASDNDITIQTFINKNNIVKIEKTGSIVLQGRYILEIIRKLPGDIISLEVVDEYKVWIHSNTSEFNLNAINPDEFPQNNMDITKTPIIIKKTELKNIINQTSFATSTQESRPLLTGINFKINNNTLECTATDSYRLSKKVININNIVDNDVNIVIPCRNLLELIKILKDDDGFIELHLFNNKILFKFDNILFQSRLLNGTYPDTSKLIPEEFILKMEAPLQELYNVIDRASLLSSDKEKSIIRLETKNDTLLISSNAPEVGRVEESLSIKKETESDIIISWSSKYMMDAIKAIKSERVILLFNSEIKPIILKDPNDPNITELILPIRTY